MNCGFSYGGFFALSLSQKDINIHANDTCFFSLLLKAATVWMMAKLTVIATATAALQPQCDFSKWHIFNHILIHQAACLSISWRAKNIKWPVLMRSFLGFLTPDALLGSLQQMPVRSVCNFSWFFYEVKTLWIFSDFGSVSHCHMEKFINRLSGCRTDAKVLYRLCFKLNFIFCDSTN